MLSVEAVQARSASNGPIAVAVSWPGTLGGRVSASGPSRLVPKAASSNTTS